MPYVEKKQRSRIINGMSPPETPGELNFMISHVCREYMRHKQKRYSTFNDIMGALDGAKLEFYRRIIGPYEDRAILKNGDIFDDKDLA